MADKAPDGPPPAYHEAVGAGSSSGTHLQVPSRLRSQARNGISEAHRRSMEDENRPLPEGWVRQFDATSGHQFFVDSRSEPPRAIWHHPYDDEQYLESVSPKERERVMALHKHPTKADYEAESSEDEDYHDDKNASHRPAVGQGQHPAPKEKEKESFSTRMKDKLTGTTHTEREQQRQVRAREEERAYQNHLRIRQAMVQAERTGQPQLIGKDSQGHDLYIESSRGPGTGYSGGGRSVNPYASGPYANPNAKFIRPQQPYQRGYGYGYGGGMGMPLMGGMMGGMMLGGMMGGGFGGGF